MVNAHELRIGNLLWWNPKLMHPQSTLDKQMVESVVIMADKIGYTFPNLDHRVEPFEDDLLQTESRVKHLEELEPIMLTSEVLEKCSFSEAVENFKKENLKQTEEGYVYKYHSIKIAVNHLHQLQNLYFSLCAEELDVYF